MAIAIEGQMSLFDIDIEQDEQFSEDWMCCNDQSDNFGDYTGYEDGCPEYERR